MVSRFFHSLAAHDRQQITCDNDDKSIEIEIYDRDLSSNSSVSDDGGKGML